MTILNKDQKFNSEMTYHEEILTKIAKQFEEKCPRQSPTIYEYRD